MAMKPWKSEAGGAQLEAYVGAYGVKTGKYATTGELIRDAAILFDIDPLPSCQEMAAAITTLGKGVRSKLAHKNTHLLAADPQPEQPSAASVGAIDRMMAASVPQFVDGAPFGVDGQVDVDPAKLLRKVVSAVIASGHADILWEFPDVLAFFHARIPAPGELVGHHNVQ